MEPMKQCPNCGRPVSPDKTYCMSCGTTLGVRCPDCRKVLPVGSKACDACGHSFVQRQKKQRPSLLPMLNKYADPVLGYVALFLTLLFLILCALPSVRYAMTETVKGTETTLEWKLSGSVLIGYFLGAHPSHFTSLLELSIFEDIATGLRFSMYGIGLGWLIALVGILLAGVLLLGNRRRMTRLTSRRLTLPLLLTVGGAGLVFGLERVIRHLIVGACNDSLLAAAGGAGVLTPALPEELPYAVGATAPLLLLIPALLFAAVALILHVLVFRKRQANGQSPEEYRLGTLLKRPLVAVCRGAVRLGYATISGVRRLFRKGGRTSASSAAKKKKKSPDERVVVCTSRFTIYLFLLLAALIFTQALLSKVSNIFFWFVLLLPGALLVYALIARAALSVSMLSTSATTEKNTPYTYEFRIDNHAPLAFPFIEAQVSIPQSNSVRTSERTIRLAMAPLSSYHMKNTVRFRFRGTYDIGVRCFYVYDFFRLFRVRVPVENMTTVYVLPRRLSVGDVMAQSVSDSTVRTVHAPLVVDKLEVSDIRDYRIGDPLKSIHWKLSSKSEEFIVKDYNTGTANQTVVFCDLSAHFPDEPPKKEETPPPVAPAPKKKASRKKKGAAGESAPDLPPTEAPASARVEPVRDVHELASAAYYEDMNEYLADGVVELTIANVLAELHRGHEVLLLWFDRRSSLGLYAYQLRGIEDLENIYRQFGTAPLCEKDKSVSLLTALVGDTENAKQLFVVPSLDAPTLAALSALPTISDAANFGSTEVLLYNPEERFRYPQERTSYLEGCREHLATGGASLVICGSHTQTQPDDAATPVGASTSDTKKASGKGGINREP